jgi:hypothetical protein
MGDLQTLFTNCKDSLVSLDITYTNRIQFQRLVDRLPIFANVRNLTFTIDSDITDHGVEGDDIKNSKIRDFFSKFPNLSNLRVNDDHADYPLQALSTDNLPSFSKSLTSLHLVINQNPLIVDMGVFPNLVKLHFAAPHWQQLDTMMGYIQPLQYLEEIILEGKFNCAKSPAFKYGRQLTSRFMSLRSRGMKRIHVQKSLALGWRSQQTNLITLLKEQFVRLVDDELIYQHSSPSSHTFYIVNVLSSLT